MPTNTISSVYQGVIQLAVVGFLIGELLLIELVSFQQAKSLLAQEQTTDFSLRFFGSGERDLDRVKIPLGPIADGRLTASYPVNAGLDLTIEFWMKAEAADNPAPACTSANWYYGHLILDRDVDGAGDYGDYAVVLCAGRIGFVVASGFQLNVISGSSVVADGRWHHIALTRNSSTGQMRIFVDGILDAAGQGPLGRIDYRLNRPTNQPNSDPYLVLGAEKHDYPGSRYYNGFLDDLRISNIVRYNAGFERPIEPHPSDPNTVALYRFDEGSGVIVSDSSGAGGGPSNGEIRSGGPLGGPIWSNDTPFTSLPVPTTTMTPSATAVAPTSTPTNLPPTNTSTATAIAPTSTPTNLPPTSTPTATAVAPTSTPTNLPPTSTPTATAVALTSTPTATAVAPTSTPLANPAGSALSFAGGDDQVRGSQLSNLTTSHTVEFWVRPATNNQNSLLVLTTDDRTGWSIELENGQPVWWMHNTNNVWRVVRSGTTLMANSWYHIAATYDATNGSARVFVNGIPGASVTVGALTAGPTLRLGGLAPYPFFIGQLDELRFSNIVRYSNNFTRPTTVFTPDLNTLALYSFDEGTGNFVADRSGNGYTLTLGTTATTDSADPAWVASTAPLSSVNTIPTATNTPLPTVTNTPLPTATDTPLPTATNTPLPTATNTPLPTATNTPLPTATNTPLPTATNTPLPTATNTPLPTATNTPLPTTTNTPLPTATDTPLPTATNTPLPTATDTPLPTATNTLLPTATDTPIPTVTNTPLPTATNTPLPTATNTPLPTATDTPLPTATDTPLPTATNTPLPTATDTPLPTATNTLLPTAIDTPIPTVTNTPLPTATNTPLPTATNTPLPTVTNTPLPTATDTPLPTATNTPLPTATNTPLPTVTNTPLPTATDTPLPTATNTPLPTATDTPLPTATNTPLPTATNTPLPTATNTPLPTATNTPLPTATNTPLPTTTNTPLPTVTSTPLPTATDTPLPTATNTPLPTATNTPLPSPTSVVGAGSALIFAGDAIVSRNTALPGLANDHTVELWVRPESSNQSSVIIATTDDQTGWSLELNEGRVVWWLRTSTNQWRSATRNTSLVAGTWYHVAVTYSAATGRARVFVNGAAGTSVTIGAITTGPRFQLGGIARYPFYRGQIDELRVSRIVRYSAAFTRPTTTFTTDANTLALYSFDEGDGQEVFDRSGNAHTLTLGTSTAVETTDPTWVNSTAPLTAVMP